VTGRDRGQSTVELALTMPFVCVLLMGVVQVAVVVRDRLAVQIAAREAARAAAVSPTGGAADRAAEAAVTLRPLRVHTVDDGRALRVTVRYTDHTDVPLIGALLPDVEVEATVAMAVEPP
jgi:Flp pilus assembly protein TadG